jgi:hypothetical protein
MRPRPDGRGVGRELGLVRGVVADRVQVSIALDPWLDLRALADYASLSVRKLRDLLGDLEHPLPHYRIGGKVLVRRSDYDAWAARYRTVGLRGHVDAIVDEVLSGL